MSEGTLKPCRELDEYYSDKSDEFIRRSQAHMKHGAKESVFTNVLPVLSRCPFCGGKAYVARGMRDRIGLWHSAVLCENPECEASVPCTPATDPSDSMQEAVSRWNRRHERTCHDTAENIGFSVVRTFTCSECGETANIVRRSPSFCPSCGARVVVDE